MESKADTRLVMISSLRVKAEVQRSGPQPLAGMSQRFPSKAMVAWMEEERGAGGAPGTHARGCPARVQPVVVEACYVATKTTSRKTLEPLEMFWVAFKTKSVDRTLGICW
jgi:hypothetical protein